MTKGNTNPAQRNRALRKEFKKRQLPLSGVMEFTPNDLRLENQRLTKLLDFIQLYKEWGSFEMIELMTGEYPFAPVFGW